MLGSVSLSCIYVSYFVTAITYMGDSGSEKSLTNGYFDEVITKYQVSLSCTILLQQNCLSLDEKLQLQRSKWCFLPFPESVIIPYLCVVIVTEGNRGLPAQTMKTCRPLATAFTFQMYF